MPDHREEDEFAEIARVREAERASIETSPESFDRMAFARQALDLVNPTGTVVALCEGRTRVRVEAGRRWGREGKRWAMLTIPPRASRRAIALAVAELADEPEPWTLDVLLSAPAYR